MKHYINIMEELVEEEYEKQKGFLDCCTCDLCRTDIIAYTLNHVPPRYVATRTGALMSKLDTLRIQATTDIRTTLGRASLIVKEHPRHDK